MRHRNAIANSVRTLTAKTRPELSRMFGVRVSPHLDRPTHRFGFGPTVASKRATALTAAAWVLPHSGLSVAETTSCQT